MCYSPKKYHQTLCAGCNEFWYKVSIMMASIMRAYYNQNFENKLQQNINLNSHLTLDQNVYFENHPYLTLEALVDQDANILSMECLKSKLPNIIKSSHWLTVNSLKSSTRLLRENIRKSYDVPICPTLPVFNTETLVLNPGRQGCSYLYKILAADFKPKQVWNHPFVKLEEKCGPFPTEERLKIIHG